MVIDLRKEDPVKLNNIKLIALDLDDTLLTKHKVITERTLSVLKEAMRRGIYVTLNTGRMPVCALPFARQIGTTIPSSCYQGTCLCYPDGTYYKKRLLDKSVAEEILRFLEPFGTHVNLYYEPCIYVKNKTKVLERYRESIQMPETVVVPDLVLEVSKHIEGPNKIVTIPEDPKVGTEIYTQALKRFPELTVTASEPTFIEFGRGDCTKSSGTLEIASLLGLDSSQVMAIGDSPNDIDFLEAAGVGVAMSNSCEEVLAVAQYISASNEEDGVALAIEKLLF